MAFQNISIRDLEQSQYGSVWIINSAMQSEYEFEGELLINIPTAQGKPDLMKVPQSWLPYEVTAQFPKSRILESSEFRSSLGKGVITLISEEQAAQLGKIDGAKEERQRLRALAQHVRQSGATRSISDANVTITNPNELTRSNGVPVETYGPQATSSSEIKASGGQQVDANGLKPNFVTFFARVQNMDDLAALNAYRNKGSLSRRELRWMRDNLRAHPKTVKAIKSRLMEIKRELAAKSGA